MKDCIKNLVLENSQTRVLNVKLKRLYPIKAFQAYTIYEKEIGEWLSSQIPLYVEGQIIYVNCDNRQLINSETHLIEELVKELGYHDCYIREKSDKNKFFNALYGKLYDKLLRLISGNEEELIIALLTMVEYNRFLEYSIIFWNYNEEIPKENMFAKIMVESIKQLSEYSSFSEDRQNSYYQILEIIESRFATDKNAIEHGIELIVKRLSQNRKETNNINGEKIDILEVLYCLRAIMMVRYLRINYTEGVYKKYEIHVDKMGNTKFVGQNIECYRNFISAQREKQKIYESIEIEGNRYDKQLDKILKRQKGFGFQCVKHILDELDTCEVFLEDILIGTREEWIEVLKKCEKCAVSEVEALFDALVLTPIDNIFSEEERYERRIMRQPIVKVGQMYVSIYNIFKQGICNWLVGIRRGEIYDLNERAEYQQVYEKINIKFEEVVYNYLKKKLAVRAIRYDVKSSYIKTEEDVQILPGQIDVLMALENAIFVIECKNLDLKIEPRSDSNEYNKLTKDGKKSFQGKLERKRRAIEENLDYVLRYLGIDVEEREEWKVVGVIVTKNFSKASMVSNLKNDIVCISDLEQWVKEQMCIL